MEEANPSVEQVRDDNGKLSEDVPPNGNPDMGSWWIQYRKFIRNATRPVLKKMGLIDDLPFDDEGNNRYHIEDVIGVGLPLAAISIIGGVASRRSKKRKTMRSISKTFESGMSSLKSLAFGKQRRSKRSNKRKAKRSNRRKSNRR